MRTGLARALSRILVVAVCVGFVPAAFGDDVSNLARRLATLRGEIEEMSSELQSKKDAHRAVMRTLADQRAELSVQLRREGLRVGQVVAAKTRLKETAGDREALDESFRPVLLEGIAKLKTQVRAGLPFRTKERLDDLDKLQTQVQSKLVPLAEAVHRLWQAHEDELRMTRESGLYRQTIRLDQKEVLAEVARLGMVALFFRTNDKKYGWAVNVDGTWRYQVTSDRWARQSIAGLFDAFKKQVRVGVFKLPNALPKAEVL